MRGWLAAALMLILLQGAVFGAATTASPSAPLALQYELPAGRAAAAFLDTGPDGVLVFGGDSGSMTQSSTIFRWRDGQDAEDTGDRLPMPRWSQAAVWTGKEAYLFGGTKAPQVAVHDIVRYVPGHDAELLPVQLPMNRDWMAAFWDARTTATCPEGCAYIFGGTSWSEGYTDQILRFEPKAMRVDVMDARLPSARWGMGAGWDGTHAYLVGGVVGRTEFQGFRDILRFDPMADSIETVGQLPLPTADSSAVWMDGALYIAGGHDTVEPYGRATLLRWAPGEAVTTSCLPLLHPVWKAGLVSRPDGLWLFGGYEDFAYGVEISKAIRPVHWLDCVAVDRAVLNVDVGEGIAPAILSTVLAVTPEKPAVAKPSADVTVTWSTLEGRDLVASTVLAGKGDRLQDLPPTPQGEPILFAEIRSTVDGKVEEVKLEFEVDGEVPAEELAIYRYDGTEWDAITPGAAVGTLEEPVQVKDAGAEPGRLWAVVDSDGLYAVAGSIPTLTGSDGGRPALPAGPTGLAHGLEWPVLAAMGAVGVALVALACWALVRESRRSP